MLKMIFFPVFLIDALLHLVACWKGNTRYAGWTKAFLMPLLAVCVVPVVDSASFFLLVGLLFGAAGDILLLKSELRWCFLLGAGAFCVGHLFYIALFAESLPISSVPFWWMVAIVFLYLLVIIGIYRSLRPFLPPGLWPVPICYMLAISCMSAFSVFRFIYWPAFWPGLAMVGTFFFMASDTRLAFAIFKGATKRSSFFVMSTYIAAQTCIASSYIWQ